MRLFVTGGTGFVGRRAVTRAVADGHQVTGLARSSRSADDLARLGAQAVLGDLDDPPSVAAAFRVGKCDALLNIASLGFGHAGTVVAAATAAGLSRAVFVSTTAIFTTLDASSKHVRTAAEETIRASGLEWTIVRPTMIYGAPDDRNMCRLLTALRRFPVLPVPGGGRHLQQPVHVDDLAGLLIRAVQAEVAVARAYDVAGPEPLTFRQIVQQAGAAAGRRAVCLPVPTRPARKIVAVYERRSARPRLRAEQVARLTEDKAFPIDAAVSDLGFRPRSFAEGIRAEAEMLRAGRAAPSPGTAR